LILDIYESNLEAMASMSMRRTPFQRIRPIMSFNGEMGDPGLECAPLSTKGFQSSFEELQKSSRATVTVTKFKD
jgi:hypothetical protein